MVYECGSHCCQPKAIKRRVPYSPGGFAYEFSYVVRMRFFWFLRDVSTSRPCRKQGPIRRAASVQAKCLWPLRRFTKNNGGYGSLLSQGRLVESLRDLSN